MSQSHTERWLCCSAFSFSASPRDGSSTSQGESSSPHSNFFGNIIKDTLKRHVFMVSLNAVKLWVKTNHQKSEMAEMSQIGCITSLERLRQDDVSLSQCGIHQCLPLF